MEHDSFQTETRDSRLQDCRPQDVQQDHDVDITDDMMVDQSMQTLHLPPGLDLLFQILDEMSDGFIPPPAEKVTPTPYYRTPSLGS
ncbi:hypothetical protein [Acidithiobacillus sp.]|uniref:hypothetical protein n=1 Tax=Acidithiobacillus sp. TaxID=1872118 RepID=UPI003CFEDB48